MPLRLPVSRNPLRDCLCNPRVNLFYCILFFSPVWVVGQRSANTDLVICLQVLWEQRFECHGHRGGEWAWDRVAEGTSGHSSGVVSRERICL